MDHHSTLFNLGTVGGLTDGQLLERFMTGPRGAAEAAFAALIQRHGSMVLQTCRGVLSDPHDADDAFQATFLVLVKKARGLWVQDSLGPWLHQVAFRTASSARAATVRRQGHERRAAASVITAAPSSGEGSGTQGEWERRVLHEEIARLPERYRIPMVLCGLEGLTQEQVAQRLRWPIGTVKSRLARGREKLRVRLTRRGLAPVATLAASVAAESAQAWVPSTLAKATLQAVQGMVAGPLPAGAVSAAVLRLMKGTIRIMFTHNLKNAVILVVLPLGAFVAYLGTLPGARATDGPPATTSSTVGKAAKEPDGRIAPLLGNWNQKGPEFDDSRVSIKLLSADPGISKGLGFEAPFVCTFTLLEPGKPDPKPYQLAFVDPAFNPPHITFLPLSCGASDSGSPEDGYPAIYFIEGETLTIHRSNGGVPRPSDFEPSKERRTQLEVYQRDSGKPTAEPKAGNVPDPK